MSQPFPFTALVGQAAMTQAMVLTAIDPASAACWCSATVVPEKAPPPAPAPPCCPTSPPSKAAR